MNVNNLETILYWVANWYKSVYDKNATKLHNNWLIIIPNYFRRKNNVTQ